MVAKTAKVLLFVAVDILLVKLFLIAVLLINTWADRAMTWLDVQPGKPHIESIETSKKSSKRKPLKTSKKRSKPESADCLKKRHHTRNHK